MGAENASVITALDVDLTPVDEGKKEKGREGLFCYPKRSGKVE